VSPYKVDRKLVISHGAESLKTATGEVAVQVITNLSWVQERFAKTLSDWRSQAGVTSNLPLLSVLGASGY
jgi:hypothetical protein